MANAQRAIKSVYRKVVPASVRNSPFIDRLKRRLVSLLPYDLIYDLDYYADFVEGPAVHSAGPISGSILTDFKPKRVVDVGCGTGALLEALRGKGCEVFGLEYSEAALECCRARHLNVAKFNLARDYFQDESTFDVAVSMEVAEHLPKGIADRYVDLLTHLSQVVVFTAAPPGQRGLDHINLRPYSYWISKFRQRCFEQNEELSQRWRDGWKATGEVETWYYQNLMIFQEIEGHSNTSGSGNSP